MLSRLLRENGSAFLRETGAGVLLREDSGAADEVLSGGFLHYYDRYSSRRVRERQRIEEDEDATRSLQDKVDAEIAHLLHEQARLDAERADRTRLQALAAEFAGRTPELPQEVSKALQAVKERQTLGSLAALTREIERMQDEEDFAVLMLMASED